jgi:hypothetical protein
MSYTPSLRQLWRLYKAYVTTEPDIARREMVLAQNSFYAGARAILKVQAFLLERGRYDELHAMIEKHGRQIDKLIKPARLERH